MKLNKLLYRIFINCPSLIAELIPNVPSNCEFQYSDPVIEETEIRLGGLLTPIKNNDQIPLTFIASQMQRDPKFYSPYFQGIFGDIDQDEIRIKMKTDKLFYRIFLNQPGLIAELIPGIPEDCEFEYSAPVIKEKETRLDGLLTPIDDNPEIPLIFLEAQMQRDKKFYSRYFRGIFSYLDQYEISRNWHGLLILRNNRLELGSEIPYQILLNNQVERLYLEDLLYQDDLSPNLALLRLIVTPKAKAAEEARQILDSATSETEFRLRLDLVEAILVNKFSKLTIEEIQKMLNLKEADVTQTRFYQEVLQIGEKQGLQQGLQQGVQQGVQQGEANLTIRQLKRRCGNLTPVQEKKVRLLTIAELESLGEALLDFQNMSDLESWFKNNSLDFYS